MIALQNKFSRWSPKFAKNRNGGFFRTYGGQVSRIYLFIEVHLLLCQLIPLHSCEYLWLFLKWNVTMNKRYNWSGCTKLALGASWTHGLIAQSVRASERNSVDYIKKGILLNKIRNHSKPLKLQQNIKTCY